jgi:hypothetical protein
MLAALGKPTAEGDLKKLGDYEKDQKEIEEQGHEYESSSAEHMQAHKSFAYAVTIFQIAIAMGAIAVLVRIPALWFMSLASGAAGLLFLIKGLF